MPNQTDLSYIRYFYEEVNKMRSVIKEIKSLYNLHIHEIELLMLIIENQPAEKRSIIDCTTMTIQPFNAALKNLLEKDLVIKKRGNDDERTVSLSINPDKEEEITRLMESVEDMIRQQDIQFSSTRLFSAGNFGQSRIRKFY